MSAPRGFTKAKRDEYLAEIRQGTRRGAAAEMLGFERRAVLDFIDSDPGMRAAVEDAEREATELVEEALFQAAVSGSVPAAKLWLEYQGKMPASGGAQRPVGSQTTVPEDGDFADLDNVEPIRGRRR